MSSSVRPPRLRTRLTRRTWLLQVANVDAIIRAAQSLWSMLQQCGGEAILRVALELAVAPKEVKDLEAVGPADVAERTLAREIMQTSLMLMDRLDIPRDEESEGDLAAGEKVSELDFPLPTQDDDRKLLPPRELSSLRDDFLKTCKSGSCADAADKENFYMHQSSIRKRVTPMASADPSRGATNHETLAENQTWGRAGEQHKLQNQLGAHAQGWRDPWSAVYDGTRDGSCWRATTVHIPNFENCCSNAPFHASTYPPGNSVQVSHSTADFPRNSRSPLYDSSDANTIKNDGINTASFLEETANESVTSLTPTPSHPQRHATIMETDSVTWHKEARHLHTKLSQAHAQFAAMHRKIKFMRRQERAAAGGQLQSTGDVDVDDPRCELLLEDIAKSWEQLYLEFGVQAERLDKKRKEHAEQPADAEHGLAEQEKKPKQDTELQEAERAGGNFAQQWSAPLTGFRRGDPGFGLTATQGAANAASDSHENELPARSISLPSNDKSVSSSAVRVLSRKQRTFPRVPTIPLSPQKIHVSHFDASSCAIASPPLAPRQHTSTTDTKNAMNTMPCKKRNEPFASKATACDSPTWGPMKSDTRNSDNYLHRRMGGKFFSGVATPLGRYVAALDPLDTELKVNLCGAPLHSDVDRIPESLKVERRMPVRSSLTRNEEATSS